MAEMQDYSLSARVFQKIREDIIAGKYAEHDELREITIGKELGVSRTPVREALRQLELEGLVSIVPNRGAYVNGISKKDIWDIYYMRSTLEGLCARWAVENITEEELALLKEAEGFVTKFEAAMDDDFNTADALAAIFELVKFANTNVNENSSKEFAAGLYEELFKLSDVLGLKIEKKEEILDKEIEDLIQERQAARKAKDFKRADEIRDELLKKGIILKDTREGVKWQRA